MLNSVCVVGSLMDVDLNEPKIRYLKVERVFSKFKESVEIDVIPICNWNKQEKGEIFSFANKSLVVIRGRLETLGQRIVIVVETITYLGLKY